MKIGVIAMSGKPVTVGHVTLIQLASIACDEVHVYVSLSDRKRPGEYPIYGSDMQIIWEEHIKHILPENARVIYSKVPVRSVYEEIGLANETHSENEYVVYGDPTDVVQNFPEKSLIKYAGDLYKRGNVKTRGVERAGNTDISGTKMRKFLASGDKQSFIKGLPHNVDGQAIWNILNKRSNEAVKLLKSFIVESIQ